MNRLLDFSLIAEITGGEWVTPPQDPNRILTGGAFDTRSLGNAEIFFAWQGENSDGHSYLHHLRGTDIKLAIVERPVPAQTEIAILQVPDSMKALHQLARYLARQFKGKIINLTGSSGKTTTKTWLTHILREHFHLLSNPGSFNNQIGCPVSVLSMQADHELMILEMGASEPGDLELLSSIAPADIALLLNVGHAHLGKFGSLENTYRAKAEIFANLREDAVIIVPAADRRLTRYLPDRPVITFGREGADVSFRVVETDGKGFRQTIAFQSELGNHQLVINQPGEYVGELLSAILAVCRQLGLSWQDLEGKLGRLPQEKGRSTFLDGLNGSKLLDDTYNANPESTVNMLKTICSLEMRRTVGVVGNLAELEKNLSSSADHIVDGIPGGITDLILSGETGEILLPLIRQRWPKINTRLAGNIREVVTVVKPMLDAQTVVGIKGSRSSHMERVVLELTGSRFSCQLEKCFRLNRCDVCEKL